MWKKTDKLKHETLKFKNAELMMEFAADLYKLSELEVVNYKIVDKKGFMLSFTDKFTDYYNTNFDKIHLMTIGNMAGALRLFPEEFPNDKKTRDEQFASMFYGTLLIAFIQDMKLTDKINKNDIELTSRLIITLEQVKDMIIYDKKLEDSKQ